MQFWQIVVGLGVPGLSLGILYMLFKRFDWDLNRKGPRGAAIILMVLVTGITAFALYLYSGPAKDEPYRLLITVLNQDGLPISDAEIKTDTTEQIRALDNAWELVVRDRNVGDLVTLYATSGFFAGKEILKLTKKKEYRVAIPLKKRTDGVISGRVTDPEGKPVPGVQVSVLGHEPEGFTSDDQGHFKLKAYAAPGEEVRVSAGKENLSWNGYLLAGEPTEIRLKEREH